MSVYSNFMLESVGGKSSAEYLPTVDVDSLLESNDIVAAFEENSYEAAMRCVAENSQNYNAIMEACAIQEFCYLEENGTEMVYTEGTLSSWKDSAIAFFKKVWDKIQSIFKKVLMQFASWSKSDKDFLKKYEKDLNRKANSGFGDTEVKVYHYPAFLDKDGAEAIKDAVDAAEQAGLLKDLQNNSAETAIAAIAKLANSSVTMNSKESLEDAVKKLNEDNDIIGDELDKVRARMVNSIKSGIAGDECSANEFAKYIAEAYQGDTTKDDVALGTALEKAKNFLKFSDKAKTELGKLLTTNKKSIDNAIKAVTNFAKVLDKGGTYTDKDGNTSSHVGRSKDSSTPEANISGLKHSLANKAIGFLKAEKNILTQFNGASLQHLKACSRQCKAVCVKAATYIDKDKNYKNESAFQSESATSLLGSIEMI